MDGGKPVPTHHTAMITSASLMQSTDGTWRIRLYNHEGKTDYAEDDLADWLECIERITAALSRRTLASAEQASEAGKGLRVQAPAGRKKGKSR